MNSIEIPWFRRANKFVRATKIHFFPKTVSGLSQASASGSAKFKLINCTVPDLDVTMNLLLFIVFLAIVTNGVSLESIHIGKNRFGNRLADLRRSDLSVVADSNPAVETKPKLRDIAAKGLGYVVGAGAMTMYSPIIYKLIMNKGSDGLSLQTFIINFVGVSLAMSYPYKKGYPVSTYVELIAMVTQYFGILGLLCYHRGLMSYFISGMSVYLLFYGFLLRSKSISPKALSGIQLISLVLCNYANIPQIIYSFRTQKTSWSPITSLCSITGCSIRIFTTLTLTKDRLALLGYSFALVTNCILLSQIVMFGDK